MPFKCILPLLHQNLSLHFVAVSVDYFKYQEKQFPVPFIHILNGVRILGILNSKEHLSKSDLSLFMTN